MQELSRVTRQGGIIVIGIPIFPFGLHLIRRYVIPVTDRLFKVKKIRGHVQAWCKYGFLSELKSICPELNILVCRGFRIVSGGLIGSLEFYRWWWQLNRIIGGYAPSLCSEIQVIARKQHISTIVTQDEYS